MSTLINPGTTPQVYTDDGRTLPAGERAEGVELDATGQSAVDAGRLIVAEEKKVVRKPPARSGPELSPSASKPEPDAD